MTDANSKITLVPFKTRRRKQTASERRFTFVESKVVYDEPTPAVSQSKVVTVSSKRIDETVNTRGDLFRIVIAASVIIVVQVVLSLTLR
ncbi:MAG: hypothetical protein Q8P25_03395 [Candidatus Curtissbacteria bacterium]|nr:hypothetical protein [Candidatus Curtissbacteria bacterium]